MTRWPNFSIVLASRSPRRAELLRAAGFEFETLAVDVDERVRNGEDADAYVRRLAGEKSARAQELLGRHETRPQYRDPSPIVAADTAVVLDGQILGKPDDDTAAASMLR